jgi:hypothetical protein
VYGPVTLWVLVQLKVYLYHCCKKHHYDCVCGPVTLWVLVQLKVYLYHCCKEHHYDCVYLRWMGKLKRASSQLNRPFWTPFFFRTSPSYVWTLLLQSQPEHCVLALVPRGSIFRPIFMQTSFIILGHSNYPPPPKSAVLVSEVICILNMVYEGLHVL